MKKTVVTLVALSLFAGVVSCKKEKEEIPDPSAEETYQDPTYVEGVFNPGRHLSEMRGDSVDIAYQWDASNPSRLTGITDFLNGNRYTFEYDASGRVANAKSTKGGQAVTLAYAYGDNGVSRIEAKQGFSSLAQASVSHGGSKISSIDFSSFDVTYMLSLMGLSYNFSDADIDQSEYHAAYTWTGDNVTHVQGAGIVSGSVTLSELYEIFGDDLLSGSLGGSLSQYAAFIPMLLELVAGDDCVFTIEMEDESNLSYDEKRNPLRGCWSEGLLFHAESLSSNNIVSSSITGNAHFSTTVTLTLPEDCPSFIPEAYQSYWPVIYMFLNNTPIPVEKDMPYGGSFSVSYEYNSLGFPTAVSTNGQRATYSYKD